MSNRFPVPLLLITLSVLLSSCSSTTSPSTKQSNEQWSSSTPPFQTREPESYKADRIITTTDANGISIMSTTSITRSGRMRREEIKMGNSKQIVFLETEAFRLVLNSDDKVYAEVKPEDGEPDVDLSELGASPEKLIYQNQVATSYTKMGTEVIEGRSTTKYQVVVNTSPAASVSKGETLIWIDESLGMAIKSDSKGEDGSRVVMEMKNISLEVDKSVFEMPQGYEKVTAVEFRQRLMKR